MVNDPRGTVESVCRFLDLKFFPEMLDVPVKASSFMNSQKGATGILAQAKSNWIRHLGRPSRIWFRIACHPGLREFSYLGAMKG